MVKKKYKLKTICLIAFMCLFLTGCESSENYSDIKGLRELGDAFETRIQNNKEMLDRYYNTGLIDDNTYVNANAHIDSLLKDANTIKNATAIDSAGVKPSELAEVVDKLAIGIEGVNYYVGTFRWTCTHNKVTYNHAIRVWIIRDDKYGKNYDCAIVTNDDCGVSGCKARILTDDDPIEICRNNQGINELSSQIGDVDWSKGPTGSFLYLQHWILSDMSNLQSSLADMKKFNVHNGFSGVTYYTEDKVDQSAITALNNNPAGSDNTKIGLGYEIFDTETAKKINESMNLEIWVLDPDALQEASLDELANKLAVYKGIDMNKVAIDETVSSNSTGKTTNTYNGQTVTAQDILKYFKPATDVSTQSNVYMYLQELQANPWTNLQADEFKEWNLAPIHSSSVSGFTAYRTGTISDLGHDMTVRCGNDTSGSGWDNLVFRLYEFNYDVYEELKSRGIIGENNFLRVTVDNDSDASSTHDVLLLMKYPISTINNMHETADGKSVYFETDDETSNSNDDCQLEVNIMTGKITKTKGYTGSDPATVEDKDSPYTIIAQENSTQNTIELSTSSYVLYGKRLIKLDECGYVGTKFIDAKRNASEHADKDALADFYTSRIVLRDYLEATYMPNLIGSDPLVVYGRKIRFIKFPTKDAPIEKSIALANFVDINGNKVASGKDLHCDDFADIKSLVGSSPNVKYIKWQEIKDKKASSGLGNVISENLSDAMAQISKLEYKTASKIQLTGRDFTFPGKYIDSADKGNNRLPVFHVMALNTDVAQSGLMSWINDTSETTGYNWWSKWLLNQEYSYQVAGNAIDALFEGNYQYGMATDGYVVLNLETVSMIEKQYEEQEDAERISKIATAFVIMGWLIVLFACLLPFLWLIDTSFDFGLNIVEKLSFGHWVPVKYSSDIPEMDTEERSYLDFWGILRKSIILIIMGVVLIRVNIIGLVARLTEAFGGFGEYISKKILGI